MIAQELIAQYGAYAGTFVVAFASGFLPLVAVDVLLAGLAVRTDANLAALVVLAAIATLASKLPIYYAVRGLAAIPGKGRARLERLRAWLARHPRWERSPVLVLIASSVLGLPPFSLVAGTAGVFGIRARTFSAVVLGGRLVRFAAVVAIAACWHP